MFKPMGTLLLLTVLLVVTCLLSTSVAQTARGNGQGDTWVVKDAPYRVQMTLDQQAAGEFAVEVSPAQLIEAISEIAIDRVDLRNFAFEKAVLVDDRTGQVVGGFQLVREDQPLEIDGNFAGVKEGASPWYGYQSLGDSLTFVDETIKGKAVRGIRVVRDKIANQKLSQSVQLEQDAFYLLQYMVYSDPTDSNIGIGLYDPKLRLFADLPRSYLSVLTPENQWLERARLFYASIEKPSLNVGLAYVGDCGIANVQLQKVRWQLVVHADKPVQELSLYYTARAGHRFTAPDLAQVRASDVAMPTVKAGLTSAAYRGLNPRGVEMSSDGLSLWAVPSDLPMREQTMAMTRPEQRAASANLNLARGTSETLVFAIESGTPTLEVVSAESTLGLETKFERVALIPVYDGPTPRGKRIEDRYDALVPLDYPHMPEVAGGTHVLAVTVAASKEDAHGEYQGDITLTLRTPGSEATTFTVPVRANVLPVYLKPAHHFRTQFGGQHFLTKYSKGAGPFTEDSITVADYHGYNEQNLAEASAMRLTSPEGVDLRKRKILELARQYYHRMLDYQVIPQSLTLYSGYTYKIEDPGGEQAPVLSDWDFTEYDTAIDELVIGRDAPLLAIYHTNGYQMDRMRLSNGVIYSYLPKPENYKYAWRQLPQEEFYKLVGEYFEAIAKHLDDKGVLDRGLIVVDESGPETFEVILNYVRAIRAMPHGAKLKVGHTGYKPSLWTKRKPDGQLIMDEALDIVMADNDDHFNFYEQFLNDRLRKDMEKWVYYVETDHLDLINAGLSTIITPLKLDHFGATGWYCWASFIWSMPYPHNENFGEEFTFGPVINPWENPFYHHGPGVLSFFYPPNPAGPSQTADGTIIPSLRLAMMRDGIEDIALLKVLRQGVDDTGSALTVDSDELAEAERSLNKLWGEQNVQWYLSYAAYRAFGKHLAAAAQGEATE